MLGTRTLAKWVAKRALKYAGIPLRDPALAALFGRPESYSGMDVDESTALNMSAVWSAVNLLASSQAMMPCNMYVKGETGAVDNVAHEHNITLLFNVSPNDNMTAFTFRELMMTQATTWGNAYAYIERDDDGNPLYLWPLQSSQVQPKYNDDGTLYYEWRPSGTASQVIVAADMFHLMGPGADGSMGYSVVEHARQAIGLSLATEKYGAQFFGEGATPRIILTHPADLTDKARRNVRQSWRELYSNRNDAHSVAVLSEGMSAVTVGLPPEDSQFLATRQFQVVEIARWFRVPPHLLYDLGQSTFNNIEQQNLNFLTFTMYPWMVRWMQETRRKLFVDGDDALYYCKFDTSALLAADTATRYEAYNVGRNGGWLTLNQINRKEGEPLLPPAIGDVHLAPSTMRTLEDAGPSPAIPSQTFDGITITIQQLALKGPIEAALATDVINAVIPTATDKLVNELVKRYKELGYVS